MQQKSEYIQLLKTFYKFVQNQFESTIHKIRTDNALKFQDANFQQFYNENRIIHQTTCLYTPQQNVRVERRHKYILEIARSIKIQLGINIKH